MASLISPEVFAQAYMARAMPGMVGGGMQGAMRPPGGAGAEAGLLAAHQNARMQGSPTSPAGPRGMTPLAEAAAKTKLLEAYGIDQSDEKDKYKDIPYQHLAPILQAQSQQKHQAAIMAQTQQFHDQALERTKSTEAGRAAYQKSRDERSDHKEQFGETETALRERMSQVTGLQKQFDEQYDPAEKQKIANDLMAAKQEVMKLTRARDQLLPQAPSQPAQPAAQPNQASQPVQITDDAGYAKLPSGAMFTGPDGHLRRKP